MGTVKNAGMVKHDILAYYLQGQRAEQLTGKAERPKNGKYRELRVLEPIVREAGWVEIGERFYNINREGLYRFWDWGTVRYANKDAMPEVVEAAGRYDSVIYFKKDIKTLLSSVCLVQVHGRGHEKCGFDAQLAALKKGMLSLTCGPCAEFMVELMKRVGLEARQVRLVRGRGEYNLYNNGHLVFEFWWPEYGKWVLADMTGRALFPGAKGYLSAGELCEQVRRGKDFTIETLTPAGVSHVDTTDACRGEMHGSGPLGIAMGFGGYKDFMREMMEVPSLLDEEARVWLTYEAGMKIVERVVRNSKYMAAVDKKAWNAKFYGGPVKVLG